ncbi:integrator complex subunit 6 isoform X5 [Amblyraja radiata]|uniref:integrator complex subunit 6 isoform X5 n=1 Tax=Amblyraja radiata TaxID=386614 RepID=UPI001403A41B|nr:integrator complex subunit 6 isoform X5 [Amblyraja radiata]
MPILLFLIDTSASMSQRTHLGTTYLDIAKGAVETFMKLRARDPGSRGDRYMLVSFDEPPYGIKAGWKENHATFMNELKNLQAVGLSTLGQSLRTSFDLLNLNRLVTGIDNYGQLCPLIQKVNQTEDYKSSTSYHAALPTIVDFLCCVYQGLKNILM